MPFTTEPQGNINSQVWKSLEVKVLTKGSYKIYVEEIWASTKAEKKPLLTGGKGKI